MNVRKAELERERAEIIAQLIWHRKASPIAIPVSLKSANARLWALAETLKDPERSLDASSDIRSLVGKIVLHPGEKRGRAYATLHGWLTAILDFVNDGPTSTR